MLPLRGVRVLDVTNVLAGPFSSYQLVLLGAEVIKIEQPGCGDLARQLGADVNASAKLMGNSFVAVNAGKQSVTLNLKAPEGREIFMRFVGVSDVLLENFRPGVMKRLGLNYEELSKGNPKLVYCAVSGFGQYGPLATRPAYDQIIQGMSGIMSVTGDEKNSPLRVGYPVCDTVGGITAALAICAALVEARSAGRGRMIDVSMLEATIASMGWVVSNFLNAGVVPSPMGNENFTAAPSGTFHTANGLLNIAANENYQFENLCDVIGRPELKNDPRFADRHVRRQNRTHINREVQQALLAKGALEWETVLIEARVPAGRVFTVPEVLSHPHLSERGFCASLESSSGSQQITRGGFLFRGDSTLPEAPAPQLSQHTVNWLHRLGYSDDAIERFKNDGII